MNTDQIIRALSADLSVSRFPLDVRFAATLLAGLLIALLLFGVTLGPRPDIALAIEHVRFIFKFVITLLLALCSGWRGRALPRSGRPGCWRSSPRSSFWQRWLNLLRCLHRSG